ncbi:hypothetical protein Tco_0253589, partial [Tanacetum coccineum]
ATGCQQTPKYTMKQAIQRIMWVGLWEYKTKGNMPVWCRMFQQTLYGKARAWFDKLPPGSIEKIGEAFKRMDDMLKRVDDYLRSKEAFRSTELPRGKFQRKDVPIQWVQQND